MRKMILVAAAMALVAFAVPAVASADTWTVNGGDPGTSTANGTPITVHGTLSATRNLGAPLGVVHLGPCTVHGEGEIWNQNGMGHGEITHFTIFTPCPVTSTGLGGAQICTIEEAFSSTETPWTITVEGTNVSIEGANFTDVFAEGCPLGAETGAEGTATGVFSGSSIGFTEAGDLAGGAVTLNGSVGVTAEAGAVTLH